eukprot:SAG31_NODE_46399_length_254_cov_1.335484_1_plen_40_part_01
MVAAQVHHVPEHRRMCNLIRAAARHLAGKCQTKRLQVFVT